MDQGDPERRDCPRREGGAEPHGGEDHNGYPIAVVAGHPDLIPLRRDAVAPYYKGTGELCLESSLGGFHTLELNEGETSVIQKGAYWASEEGVSLSLYRERFLTALLAGEGLFWYQTKISGKGKAVVIAPGPVDEMTLNNERLVVDGNYVVARTAGVSFTIRRPTRSSLGLATSGGQFPVLRSVSAGC